MSVTYSGTPLPSIVNQLNNIDIEIQGYIEKVALVARSLIKERLEVYLKTGADHFDVTIRPNSLLGYTISVNTVDEVGVFLFDGVSPHEITGSAMPIGGGRFAQVVHHPGFEPKSPLVYQAVIEGIAGAIEVIGSG